MMQILIKEEEAEKMRRVLLEKEMLAKKRSRLKSSRKAALRRAARSSTTTCSSRRHAQENGENLHHTTPRSETMTEERQVKWAGSNDPFDIFLKLFDGTTITLRSVRSLVSHRTLPSVCMSFTIFSRSRSFSFFLALPIWYCISHNPCEYDLNAHSNISIRSHTHVTTGPVTPLAQSKSGA